jgi:hypothetical protein
MWKQLTRAELSDCHSQAYDFLDSQLWQEIRGEIQSRVGAAEHTLRNSTDIAEIRHAQGVIAGANLLETTLYAFARYAKKRLGDAAD